MKGTFASVSRTLQAGGVVKTGFAPSSSSDARVANRSALAVRRQPEPGGRADVAIASCGVKDMPPGCSTLPTSALSALTASALNRPLVCASGGPPMMATDGPRSANSRASRSTRRAVTPVIFSTCSGV